jgi:ankyrin repeat protein
MKKIILIFGFLAPVAGYSATLEMQVQIVRDEVAKLKTERDKLKSEIEKCGKTKKGLQIAGITTSAATVGLGALDIVQSKKIKDTKADIVKNRNDTTHINAEKDRIRINSNQTQTTSQDTEEINEEQTQPSQSAQSVSPVSDYFSDKITEVQSAYTASNSDINKPNNDGYTPLMKASLYNYENIAVFLISSGADINALNDKDHNKTALMYAAGAGNEVIVKLLIDNNANKDILSLENKKASDYAKDNEFIKIVDLLK